jgi:Tfp pilus assembly protein PilF
VTNQASSRRISLGWGHLIFAGVLMLRVSSLVRLAGSPLLLPSRGDMHFYNDWALRILRGEADEHFAFYGLPGYAYLLAFVYRIFGYNPFVAGSLQALLDAGSAFLIYELARRTFSSSMTSISKSEVAVQAQPIGILAAVGWAFFVPTESYAAVLMPTAWFVFAFWFVIWRLVRRDELPSGKEILLLGFLIGLVATGVATILILVPFVLVVFFVRSKIDNLLAKRIAVLIAGLAIGTSPCWVHNYLFARDPVFLSAHSGINFWIGNNPVANGYPKFPPGLRAGQAAMLNDSIAQAEADAGHPLKRSEVSAYWSGKAKNYIATHFVDWLRLLARKFKNFWNAFQYDDLSIITSLREQGVVYPGIYFGLVAALAIPGLVLAWWMVPNSRWLIIATLLQIVALAAVFITERYRLVAVPGLLIFAAYGLSMLWTSVSTFRFQLALVYLLLLVTSTIFVAWPQSNPSLWALDAYNSGWQALESNDLSLAEKKLAIAHAYVPDNIETLFALGNLRLVEKKVADAKSFYQTVLQLDPHHKGGLNNLGVISFDEKNFTEAQQLFERALGEAPNDAKTYFLLAKTFYSQGNADAGRKAIDRALSLNPNQPEFVELKNKIDNSPAE